MVEVMDPLVTSTTTIDTFVYPAPDTASAIVMAQSGLAYVGGGVWTGQYDCRDRWGNRVKARWLQVQFPGDANNDNRVNIGDLCWLVSVLFGGDM